MRAHRTLIVSLILTLALAIPAAASGKRLIMAGSTAMLPLVQKLAAAYHQQNPKFPAPKSAGASPAAGSPKSRLVASTSRTYPATRSKATRITWCSRRWPETGSA